MKRGKGGEMGTRRDIRKQHLEGGAEILSACMIWGLGYAVMTDSLDSVPRERLMVTEYLIAAIGMTIVCLLVNLVRGRKTRAQREPLLNKSVLFFGVSSGILMWSGQYFQIGGMMDPDTTAGQVAFITALYVVIVPLLKWIWRRESLNRLYAVSIGLAVIGLLLLSMQGGVNGLTLSRGSWSTLIGSFLFSVQILVLEAGTRKNDALTLTVVQLWSAFAGARAIGVIHRTPLFVSYSMHQFGMLLYLGLLSTMMGFLLQTVGQKNLPAELTSVFMSTESVFGMLFSVLLLGEQITASKAIGGSMMLAAVLLAQRSGAGETAVPVEMNNS